MLREFMPSMLPEVKRVVDEAYPEILCRAENHLLHPVDRISLCGSAVCDITARVLTGKLFESGIGVSHEKHANHYLAVLTSSVDAPSDDDFIICATWAQWAKLSNPRLNLNAHLLSKGMSARPAYIGRRSDIAPLLPRGRYETDYSSKSVLARIGPVSVSGEVEVPDRATWTFVTPPARMDA